MASKNTYARGAHPEWLISHAKLLRFRNEGLRRVTILKVPHEHLQTVLPTRWHHGLPRRLPDVLPSLRSESVDFVLTDPSYLVGYQGRKDSDHKVIVGDENPDWLRPAFSEIWRVMKHDTFYGWPHVDTFLGIWKEIGFRPVSHLAFVKRQWGLGRFTRSGHETAFLLAKGHPPKPAVAISDVFDWQRDETALHSNQKSVASMAAILHAYCPANGVVLDPFMGSGSTLRALKSLDQRAMGIEIEEGYCKKAAARMAQGILTSFVEIETLRELPDLVRSIEGE